MRVVVVEEEEEEEEGDAVGNTDRPHLTVPFSSCDTFVDTMFTVGKYSTTYVQKCALVKLF